MVICINIKVEGNAQRNNCKVNYNCEQGFVLYALLNGLLPNCKLQTCLFGSCLLSEAFDVGDYAFHYRLVRKGVDFRAKLVGGGETQSILRGRVLSFVHQIEHFNNDWVSE